MITNQNHRLGESRTDFGNILLYVFFAALIYSAGSIAAFELAFAQLKAELSEGSGPWSHWGFSLSLYFGLEFMRGCFIFSNIFIRAKNPKWADRFAWMAGIITIGIGVKIFYQVGSFSDPNFWSLEVYNVLIVASEISISVNLAGAPINWQRYIETLKNEQAIFAWDDLPNWLYEPLAKIHSICEEYRDKIRALERKIDRSKSDTETLELFLGKREGEVEYSQEEIDDAIRMQSFGYLVSDVWVYAGDNYGYVVYCTGKSGDSICAPFKVPRSKKIERCPSCGKQHDREAARDRLLIEP